MSRPSIVPILEKIRRDLEATTDLYEAEKLLLETLLVLAEDMPARLRALLLLIASNYHNITGTTINWERIKGILSDD